MIVCVPTTAAGFIDPRWGRAARVAVATVRDGAIADWQESDVEWDRMHDEGSEGSHHARVARFLLDHQVEAVVAHHMGEGMLRMLSTMGLQVFLGADGEARAAVLAAAS
jgi:predicted Fe-Mo cluster-binding NifX family protein